MKNCLYRENYWPNDEQMLLLKAAILSDQTAINSWSAWLFQKSYNIDKIDTVSYTFLPLVYRNLQQYNLQDSVFEKCKGIYRRTWMHNQLLWQRLQPILNQLIRAGIDKMVLLKGMAMILVYYRDFGVRVIGDVDLLISRRHLKTALTILYSLGAKTSDPLFDPDNESHFVKRHAENFIFDHQTNLDLHWSFLLETAAIKLDEIILQNAQLIPANNLKIYAPNPTDLLFQTLVHGLKYSPTPLLRWIIDSMTILKTSAPLIDWNHFASMAEKIYACKLLSRALIYLNEHFSAHIPGLVIEKLQLMSSYRFELRIDWLNTHGLYIIANWYCYCLRLGHTNIFVQILKIPEYLQFASHAPNLWQTPFYCIRWLIKKISHLFISVTIMKT